MNTELKKGDKVSFYSLEYLIEKYGKNGYRSAKCQFSFTEDMSKLYPPNKIFYIKEVCSDNRIYISEKLNGNTIHTYYNFSSQMVHKADINLIFCTKKEKYQN